MQSNSLPFLQNHRRRINISKLQRMLILKNVDYIVMQLQRQVML
jgi:hypothetical protein